MSHEILTVWYASDEHANSSMKLWSYEDKGAVEFDDGVYTFRGSQFKTTIKNIQVVEFARHMPSWPFFLGTWFLGLVTRVVPPVFIFTLPILFGVTVFWVADALRKWVKVTYVTDSGYSKVAWLADGGSFGWDGIFGGTQKLHDILAGYEPFPAKRESTSEPAEIGVAPAHTGRLCVECEDYVQPDHENRCPDCGRPI